jgi:parallel beta-helix repeat protein
VICEHRLGRARGQRVGLSFGGGGTGKEYCRDGRCITEHEQGVIEANLIASCSDDGIYINRSATSRISHNTLVDTGGIVVRYAESSADVSGNLVDGAIRTRDDGLLRASDNIETALPSLYLAHHPVRELYVAAPALRLEWRTSPQQRVIDGTPPADLCGTHRSNHPVYGAFEDFRSCLR